MHGVAGCSVMLVGTRRNQTAEIRRLLEAEACLVVEASPIPARPRLSVFADCLVVDLEAAEGSVNQMRQFLAGRDARDLPRLFVVDDNSRSKAVQAQALGATAIIPRPLDGKVLLAKVEELIANGRDEPQPVVRALKTSQAILSAVFALRPGGGLTITQSDLAVACDTLLQSYRETRLADWLAAVNAHHSQTYRHCLLVTGLAAAFGHHLGLRQIDLRRVTLGSLLHDVGKAEVPVSVLEKPTRLTPSEEAIMREHPAVGRNLMLGSGEFDAEMIDVVAHHHERLDGSGYPDGLADHSLSDLVRVIAIADIFAALIEHRPYRPALTPEHAYQEMLGMRGKIDIALVKAFQPIALGARWNAAAA